jgi:signal transduction histidine kinase
LKQVLINLVGNALKFTDEGSIKIGLSVEEVEIKDEEEKAKAIKFKITDTG